MPLPAPWRSYKTKDGKEYYYNPESKVTTWTKPSGSSSTSKTPPKHSKSSASSSVSSSAASPAAGAGRGGLLAQIQQGAQLKKVKTVEKTLFATRPTENSAPSGGTSSFNGGGKMGSMMSAIKQGGNVRKTPSTGSSPSGAGGFAEIMRKNREAAARKAGGNMAPCVHHSSSEPSTPRQIGTKSNNFETGSNSTFETRLVAMEDKLDKIMAHFGIN
ncbi:hypothetical protein CCR75_007126 [Bremia lactucae]|uniref:WW domain-containing protein n=1 Tax=Bremia lactucae TaxID=4779 RepID=A0A976IC00_BRELC|nr:hypothetical protein CCR75_007126 [Bremia lactucae]